MRLCCIPVVIQVTLPRELRLLTLHFGKPRGTENFLGTFFHSSANAFDFSSVKT
jgi:hypothetical protein